jgi:hypothetical protein
MADRDWSAPSIRILTCILENNDGIGNCPLEAIHGSEMMWILGTLGCHRKIQATFA